MSYPSRKTGGGRPSPGMLAMAIASGGLLIGVARPGMRWARAEAADDRATNGEPAATGGHSSKVRADDLEDAGPTLRNKIVPILSAGTGVRIGAAQVTGPERDVDDVKAVAELEATWKGNVRARLYVPISDLNVLKGIHRVPRVGVTALADVRLKF